MARLLKPQKIEDYRHTRRGVTVTFFLDRNDHTFFFEYQKARVSRASLAELKREAWTYLNATIALTWIPMIEVERLMPFCHDGIHDVIGFNVSRSWIARKVDGHWLEATWANNTDDDREKWGTQFYPGQSVKNFTLPYFGAKSNDSKSFYLPYTEALWVGLQDLLQKINRLSIRLDELLTTPEGLAHLAATTSHLLGAFGSSVLPGTVEVMPAIEEGSDPNAR